MEEVLVVSKSTPKHVQNILFILQVEVQKYSQKVQYKHSRYF